MNKKILTPLFLFALIESAAQRPDTLNLNGRWKFDQTENAFPPSKFTRKIPVPGLISMAEPKVSQYDALFRKPDKAVFSSAHNLENLQYKPMYNWYFRKVRIGAARKGMNAVLTIQKSMFVTRVWVNGMNVGESMHCYTPIDFSIAKYLKYDAENEILIQVGDRAWLPSEAAGGTDKEKVNYLPGIWDNVFISFSGNLGIHRLLALPDIKKQEVSVKLQIRSFYPPQLLYGAPMTDSATVEISIKEKKSDKIVAAVRKRVLAKRDNLTALEIPVPLKNAHFWSPDDPFLYTAVVSVAENGENSQTKTAHFGMREFGKNGKFFTLNHKKIMIRGTNITLLRFFEDPDCKDLPWNRTWVKKLLAEIPKEKNWNMMRICVGQVPDFWYEIADESGLMLQNEWLYWQNHGWDDEIRREYTDWVWSDGNHPSIVIWDGINENYDAFIGATLIPELKQLDHTRMWDAGYMTTAELGSLDEMDEPHPYVDIAMQDNYKEFRDKNPYPLGDLDYDGGEWQEKFLSSSVPQLVNEYGWMWLWRDGSPSKLTVKNYDYYLGENASRDERRELQAYSLQLQTEWLRANRNVAGVLQFCYLTNNYGFTGDVFIGDIKNLTPSPMLKWFTHCFAPAALFINLTDERYTKHLAPHKPGSKLNFNLYAINDNPTSTGGRAKLRLLDPQGKEVWKATADVKIPPYGKTILPTDLTLPNETGGFVLLSEFTEEGKQKAVLSRRYLKVGDGNAHFNFFKVEP